MWVSNTEAEAHVESHRAGTSLSSWLTLGQLLLMSNEQIQVLPSGCGLENTDWSTHRAHWYEGLAYGMTGAINNGPACCDAFPAAHLWLLIAITWGASLGLTSLAWAWPGHPCAAVIPTMQPGLEIWLSCYFSWGKKITV